jgi:hypothetical protein
MGAAPGVGDSGPARIRDGGAAVRAASGSLPPLGASPDDVNADLGLALGMGLGQVEKVGVLLH